MQKLSKQLYYTQWQKGEENVHHIQIVDQNKHCHFFGRYDVDSLLWLSNIIANLNLNNQVCKTKVASLNLQNQICELKLET